jgi:preprotein translocase subunit SecF
MRKRWAGFGISFIMVLASLVLLFTRGLNFGIDFTGGILLEVRTEQTHDLSHLRSSLTNPAYGEVSLQHFGNQNDILIRLEGNTQQEQAETVEQAKGDINTALKGDVTYRRVDYVGPTIGKEMLESGIYALLFAFAGMMIYIWFRFEWQFGVGALIALVHDVILILGYFALSGTEFGSSAIAAILTVIGYSINDSVVIFDRIRESIRKFNKHNLSEIIDSSINQTLSRTLLTAFTTLLAAAALAAFGGEIIHGFAMALCVGVVVGTHSSIYIAAPILIYLNVNQEVFLEEESDVQEAV